MLFHVIRVNNDNHKIKGVLVSKNDKFFQILEGDETIVDPLYEIIREDSRHHKIDEILNTTTTVYAFKDFGTGYNTIKSLESLMGLQRYLNSSSIKTMSNAPLFLRTIESFFQ